MIIITGSVHARPETVEELLRLSLEHVHRSRAEGGCLLHSVLRDVEDPLRLVFLEQWEDRAAVDAHFAVPASRAFVGDVGRLAASPPEMHLYQVDPVGGR